jgi:glycerophosphoryl diester phosphodiesterase
VRAVEAALNRGADGVEVDVRLSSDGVLVCSHDPVVRTTIGPDLTVSSTTARQLRHATGDDGDRLATVHEVLAAASRHRRCQLVIEAKPVPDHATARRTAEVLRGVLQLPLPDGLEVTVSSFDNALLALVRAGLPAGVRTALLGRRAEPVHAVLHQAARSGHAEAHLHVAALRQAPHAIALAHHLGVRVTSWTVNGRDDLQRLARWGVDAVITDNVVAAQVLLNGAREASSPELGRGAAC